MHHSLILAAMLVGTGLAGAESVSLLPKADTGLFQFAPDNNLGATEALQIGTNGQGAFGRGLFCFDIAGNIPAGSRIDAVTISFTVTGAGSGVGADLHDLYRIRLGWAEGDGAGGHGEPADPGQTTWNSRFHGGDQWTVAGGSPGTDFASLPSATGPIGAAGSHTISTTSELVSDVQSWLDDPERNFGWAMISQGEGTASSTRRIGTREFPGSEPRLVVHFTPFRIYRIEKSQTGIDLDWRGGAPPFQIEQATQLNSGDWIPIATTSERSATLEMPATESFIRVREAPAPVSATYTLTWTASWSSSTHPTDFPPGAHFTKLVGANHNAALALWEPGLLASAGIRRMAETGNNATLRTEIQAAIDTGAAASLLEGTSINSPGQTQFTFEISQAHPLVSLVSMIAPSPDWFTGITSLPLFVDGRWISHLSIALQAYDAGTDSGTNFLSPNAATDPPMPVSELIPAGENRPLGTLTFERTD